jgi:hypothetical protein
MQLIDLKGKKIGKLLVVERAETEIKFNGKIKQYHAKWYCKCECGNIKSIRASNLISKNTISCGCHKRNSLWTGYEEISGNFWNSIITSAKKRQKIFSISIQYAWKLFKKQNGLCALSGKKIILEKRWSKKRMLHTASLDRIDSSKGYIEGNVQWVHKDVNFMKQAFSQEKFIALCNEISDYQKEKISPKTVN